MIVYLDIDQYSPEWREIRQGKATASNFGRIMSPKEMKYSASAIKYIYELVADCFDTGTDDAPDGSTYWTRRGHELEPLARMELAQITGLEAVQVGFCLHNNGILGFSPDCLLRLNGAYVSGGECKAPAPWTQVEYIANGVLPPEYAAQVHGSMIIGGFSEFHFISICPGMQSFYIKVTPNEYTEKLAACLDRFVGEYREVYGKLIPKLQLALPEPQPE